MTYENDGRFPEDNWVVTRYPALGMNTDTPREEWPWWVASVEQQCGEDEWQLLIWGHELATLEDESPAPEGTPDEELRYPLAFRDSSEIRLINDELGEMLRDRGGLYEGVTE